MIEFEFKFHTSFPATVKEVITKDFLVPTLIETYALKDNVSLYRKENGQFLYVDTSNANIFISSTSRYSYELSNNGLQAILKFD